VEHAPREWEALGAGYGRDDDGRWWVISLFYSDPEAADADADELLQRMQGYDTALTELAAGGLGAESHRPAMYPADGRGAEERRGLDVEHPLHYGRGRANGIDADGHGFSAAIVEKCISLSSPRLTCAYTMPKQVLHFAQTGLSP